MIVLFSEILVVLLLAFSCNAAPYDDETCGNTRQLTVGSSSQTLQSPGYDKGFFLPGQTCVWEISPAGENDKYLLINITDIDLPEHHRCDESFLEIDYMDSVGPYLRFCGNSAKEISVIPFASNPSINFYSSRLSSGGRGFKVQLQSVQNDLSCGDDQHKCTYPYKCVPISQKCNGVADCHDGSDERDCTGATKEIAEPKDICGIPSFSPDTSDGDRIVGGQETIPHSFPWQISIQGNYVFPSGHSCGGTLINSQWVVTAGHCVAGTFWRVLRIKLGAHNLFQAEDETIIRYVDLVMFHPEYNRFTSENDIALIKLSAPVKFSSSIMPACLPHYFDKEDISTGTRLFATGWGETLVRGDHDRLRQASVPVVPLEKCKEQLSEIKEVSPKSICTGFPAGGRNPCFGDSGGPLVGAKTVDNKSRWILQGVVSWGPTICGQAEHPTVFVKVSEYGDWIKETIEEN